MCSVQVESILTANLVVVRQITELNIVYLGDDINGSSYRTSGIALPHCCDKRLQFVHIHSFVSSHLCVVPKDYKCREVADSELIDRLAVAFSISFHEDDIRVLVGKLTECIMDRCHGLVLGVKELDEDKLCSGLGRKLFDGCWILVF